MTPEEDDEILFFKQNLQNAASSYVKGDFFEMLDYLAWEKTSVFLNLGVRNGRAAIVADEPLIDYLPIQKSATLPTLKGMAEDVTYEGGSFAFSYEGKQEDYLLLESSIPLEVDWTDDNGYGIELNVDEMDGANWRSVNEFNQMCRVDGGENLSNIKVNCIIDGVQVILLTKKLREIEYVNSTTLLFWFDVDRDLQEAEGITLEKVAPRQDFINLIAKELDLVIATFSL